MTLKDRVAESIKSIQISYLMAKQSFGPSVWISYDFLRTEHLKWICFIQSDGMRSGT